MKNHTLSKGMKALIETRPQNSRVTEFFVVKVTAVDSQWIYAELAGGKTRRFKVAAGPEDEPYIRRQVSSREKLQGPIDAAAAEKIWDESSKDERKRISLRVSPEFHQRVKIRATQERETLEDFCIAAIRNTLGPSEGLESLFGRIGKNKRR